MRRLLLMAAPTAALLAVATAATSANIPQPFGASAGGALTGAGAGPVAFQAGPWPFPPGVPLPPFADSRSHA